MAAPMDGEPTCKKYLILFAHEFVDFRIPELLSVASLLNVDITWDEAEYHTKQPFLIVEAKTEKDVRQIAGRCTLIRSVYELWAHGKSYEELADCLRSAPKHLMMPYFGAEQSFKFELEAFNKKLTMDYMLSRYKALPEDVLQFQGKVKLNKADNRFTLCEHYGPFGSPSTESPLDIYFGRWIADGQRDMIRKYHLQNRLFIGNTSMDAGLSLIMANIAKVKKNDVMFDPFVGTGSLLVASAHFGAYVMGTDIDYLLLHAKVRPSRAKQTCRHPSESIRANLEQYGLQQYYLDALVGDSSKRKMWRDQPMFDAIVTDPPYGIREKTEKVGSEVKDVSLTDQHKIGHIPQKVAYELGEIFKDLLNFAARFLNLNGRLTYWLPVYSSEYKEENVPQHPCLRVVYNCEQALSTKVSRRLITMEKVHHLQESAAKSEAHIKFNHYHDASFRDKYFHINKSKQNGTSKGQGHSESSTYNNITPDKCDRRLTDKGDAETCVNCDIESSETESKPSHVKDKDCKSQGHLKDTVLSEKKDLVEGLTSTSLTDNG